MIHHLVIGFLALTWVGHVASSFCICTEEYAPVCASNRKTYSNKCHMNCAGQSLSVVHQGKCSAPSCICTLQYDPVCASNGQTYSNKCFMFCKDKSLSVVHSGRCDDMKTSRDFPFPICMCTLEYAPVCASNGQTYGNSCQMGCYGNADLYVLHPGPCSKQALSKAAPSTEKSCIKPCPLYAIQGMFCGFDGEKVIDYLNGCQRDVALCQAAALNKPLRIVPCNYTKPVSCARPCPLYLIEGMYCVINATGDVIDLKNDCMRDVAICEAKQTNQLLVIHPCETRKPTVRGLTDNIKECFTICPMYYIPNKYCALVDGKIKDFGNPCFLNSAKCVAEKEGKELQEVSCVL